MHFPVYIIILPFIMAAVSFLIRKETFQWIFYIGSVVWAVCAGLLIHYVLNNGLINYPLGGWSKPFGIHLFVDGLSVLMITVVAVLNLFIGAYSFRYFECHQKDGHNVQRFFWPLYLFCLGGLNVLFLSSDYFNIYVAFEIISFSAISLIVLSSTAAALVAATQYFFLTLIGSLTYLLAGVFLYAKYSTMDLLILGEVIQPGILTIVVLALISIGLMIKAALFPMHFWLPTAHANAPSPVSAILSGLVVMGAFYLLVRFWLQIFFDVIDVNSGQILGGMGLVAIIVGALMAFWQTRLKMILAYSTVSQIGYMFLLFPLFTKDPFVQDFAFSGGIYLTLSHAFAKAAAFLVAGIILCSLGKDHIDQCRGLVEKSPFIVFTFALAGISLIGLPPSGGFIGKWMLLKASMISGQWIYSVVIVAGSVISAAYIFRILEVFLDKGAAGQNTVTIPRAMQWCAFILALTAILLGLVANLPLDVLKIGHTLAIEMTTGAEGLL